MKAVIFAVLSLVLAVVAIAMSGGPRTKTPPAFKILTDTRTGCDYLETPSGITPRLNPNGTQVCDRKAASVNAPIYGARF